MSDPVDRLSAALADRYRIEHELGAGGMATVYLAEDIKHKRKVAVKVLRPELAAVLGADRFVQEIETTASLQHPHILPLFDSGETGPVLTRGLEYPSMRFSVSPDGRWVAFESSLSGSAEVYVTPLPGPGGRHLIPSGGGMMPRWARDGGSIIYQDSEFTSWIIASVRTTPDFAVTSRRSFGGGSVGFHNVYDAAPGGRIAALRRGDAGSIVNQMRLITDWRRGLARPPR